LELEKSGNIGFVGNSRVVKRKRPWKKPVARNAMRVG
jgi:hypothetical protein